MKDGIIEIPFGAKDSELYKFEYTIPEGYEAEIKDGKVIVKKKESEDERIRKSIVKYFRMFTPGNMFDERFSFGDVVSYLEKQKEQKPEPMFKVGDKIKLKYEPKYPYREIVDIRNGAYYFDEEVHLPFDKQDKWEKEQKPAEWSEEDEENFKWFDKFFRAESILVGGRDIPQDKYLWFKSLRPQPKQDVLPSLSEKEIICLKRALDYLRKEHNRYGGEDFTNEIVVLEWLITHPILVYSSQFHWKPSKEQMEALMLAIEGKCPPTSYMSRRLEDLYEVLANEYNVECKLENSDE